MTIAEDTGPYGELEWRERRPMHIEWFYKAGQAAPHKPPRLPSPVRPCRQAKRHAARQAAKSAQRGSVPK